MKVLVINASPKGEKSNSFKLTQSFLDGFSSVVSSETKIIALSRLDLYPCRGCFACWNKTPGVCVIKDVMTSVIEDLLWADTIIFSFPLYYFGLPAPLKMLIDRQLSMALPFMDSRSSSGAHPSRYAMDQKSYVMISTCGFYTAEGNYDAVNSQLDKMYGEGNYTSLYCGQGELFRVPELKKQTDAYLKMVRRAGMEFAHGEITEDTRKILNEPLFPREVFEKMADASWGIEKELSKKERVDSSLVFTRQMASLYRKDSWKGKDLVVEFVYTDIQKRYQILLKKSESRVLTEDFLPYTTKIETPFSVWQKIGRGELSGQEAMMKHLYRVDEDFDLMLSWDTYFGITKPMDVSSLGEKKTNMSFMLIPWIFMWITLPIHPFFAGTCGIILCAILPFSFLKWKATIFEYISICAVPSLAYVPSYPIR